MALHEGDRRMRKWTTKNGFVIYRLLNSGCNVFLLTNNTSIIMVDTSIGFDWKTLHQRTKQACQEKHLEALILTHTHFDHCANAAKVKERFNPQIIVHEKEAGYLQQGWSPLPRGTHFFNRILMDFVRKIKFPFQMFNPVQADIVVEDIYNFKALGFNAYAMHTPGHTAGSLSLIVDDEIALVGDTLVGYLKGHNCPAFADEPDQLVASWTRLLDTGCQLFLPAHGREIGRGELQALVAKHH
jgi:glyoxylase-like metal-dependent hydrolase (beta-lactamase superfamily II)